MRRVFNIYSDESCHLENDGARVMVLGAVWCLKGKARKTAEGLRAIKLAHGMPPGFELKWNRVSPARIDYFKDVVRFFFETPDLHFRALVADKTGLRHAEFGQTHDDWYYKMMFGLTEPLLTPGAGFRLYLDKKDTRSARKVAKLHDVLCNNLYDFNRDIVDRVQVVESKAVEHLQLADLLAGAVGYVHRGLRESSAKCALIETIKTLSGYKLTHSTLLRESKFNIFVWKGQAGGKAT